MTNLNVDTKTIKDLIQQSEVGESQKYQIRHAGTANSGYSVGGMQTDFSALKGRRDQLIMFLKSAQIMLGENIYEIEDALKIKGDIHALPPETIKAINDALKTHRGNNLVDQLDAAQLYDVIKRTKTAIVAAQNNPLYKRNTAFKATVDSPIFQALIASNINQYGPPDSLAPFLAGKTVKIGGQKVSIDPFQDFSVASFFDYESRYSMVADPLTGGASIMRNRRKGEIQALANKGLLSSQEAVHLKQVANETYRPASYKVAFDQLRTNGVDVSIVSLSDDMALAYAQQGFAAVEAGKEWAAQYGKGGFGAEAAKLGLTVREAQAVYNAKNGEDVTNRGFSGPEMVAAARYRAEFARTGDAAMAMAKARSGLADARTYNGPSSEFSPEDFMTPEENRAQLARNTKVLEARRASLLDGGAVSVKDAPAPTIHSTRAGAQKLYQQQVAALHPDPVTAARAVRATVPEQLSMANFGALLSDALDGLQNVLGVKAASAKEMTATRGGLESAKVAGLVMDQKVADKVMRTSAYAAKDPFAVDAVRSFYGATYADNDPGAPKRQSALDEPGRKSSVESLERKHARETQARYDAAYADIERENRQRAKEQASQDRQREAEAAAEAKRVRDTAAMEDIGATPGALPTETVQVAKVDKLGDSAVRAAQVEMPARELAIAA